MDYLILIHIGCKLVFHRIACFFSCHVVGRDLGFQLQAVIVQQYPGFSRYRGNPPDRQGKHGLLRFAVIDRQFVIQGSCGFFCIFVCEPELQRQRIPIYQAHPVNHRFFLGAAGLV